MLPVFVFLCLLSIACLTASIRSIKIGENVVGYILGFIGIMVGLISSTMLL